MNKKTVEFYDLSRKEREVLEWRYARRKQLRTEYLKEILHPTKQTIPVDNALMLFSHTRMQHEYHVKLRFVPHLIVAAGFVTFISTAGTIIRKIKQYRDRIIRSGKKKYSERRYKFA
ncbi:PREDICTED: uncharacterized protein LOC108546884 [Eufriesea mexicana]|uniref:uncharacterized protein LOC108546884 n=1 Tax=Eufriesea mexicana TaxID=516756 RepID=UPI00083BB199|nr:PREDICTED: uncharacterized protein LOC108546884 [Eufriesea mexicana]